MARTAIDSVLQPARRIGRLMRSGDARAVATTLRNGVRWRLNRMRSKGGGGRERARPVQTPRLIDLTPSRGPGRSAPVVSVIVTTLNRQDLLPIALRSVQLQVDVGWECVIVDDGSTDDTVEVARSFVDADDRFRIVRHETRHGLSAARNTGIAHARGEFICFLDDDDFLLSDSLAARLAALDGCPPDVVGSFCDWINTDPHVGLEAFEPTKSPRFRGHVSFTTLRSGPPFIATSPLLRRRAVVEAGGFDETFRRAEDSEFWHRLLRLGFRLVDADHVGVAYRRSPGSMVIGDPAAQIEVLRQIEELADRPADHLEGHGPRPISEPLSDLAAVALRAPMVYRYLAMIALDDVVRAVEMGRDLVPASVRSEIDPVMLAPQLVKYVKNRCQVERPSDVFELESRVGQLIRELIPPIAAEWTSSVDVEGWLAPLRERGIVEGGSPEVVPASTLDIEASVVLMAEAKYHIDELGPLAQALERRGQRVTWMLNPKTVPPAKMAMGAFTARVAEFDPEAVKGAAAVVVLNDWGPARHVLEIANEAGVPTFAKVEGVQDFDDVDTGRVRRPYRTASVILGQGTNDERSLPHETVRVVGSSRLERIWNSPPVGISDRVLVNLNFTYRVLTDHREAWMDSVVDAVERVGAEAVVSAHPAERSRDVGLPFVDRPFRHAITESGVLISRFSTVPFEAMARGVPFVYHNPHGERVPTFQHPNGAFDVTTNVADLADSLRRSFEGPPASRDRWRDFFAAQVDIDPDRPSEDRAADVILDVIS